MKVLHLITTIDRGGAEHHLLELVRGQRAAGVEVTVCFLKGSSELRGEFAAVGAHVEGPFGLGKLQRIKARSFDLVHAHLPLAELLARLLTLRERNLVVSRHLTGKLVPRVPDWMSEYVSLFVERGTRAVIAISHATRSFLLESGHSRDPVKIQVIHYGYRPQTPQASIDFRVRYSPKRQDTALRLSCIARLTSQKDLPTLIRSVAQLVHGENRNVALRIAGAGPDHVELQSLCKMLNVETSVEFVGRISDPESFIMDSDIFVLPSIYEGFGLVMLEAAAAGTPIIAASNTSMLEVVTDGVSGLLFNTGNSKDLAQKLLLLADDPELQHSLAIGARAQLDKKFSPDRMVLETLALYQRALTNERSGVSE